MSAAAVWRQAPPSVREAAHEPNRGPISRAHTAKTKSTQNPRSRPASNTHRFTSSSCASIPEESEEDSMDGNTLQTLSDAPAGGVYKLLSSTDHSSTDTTQALMYSKPSFTPWSNHTMPTKGARFLRKNNVGQLDNHRKTTLSPWWIR